MKKIITVLSVFALAVAFNSSFAQSEKKQEIRKEVKVTEENGEMVMTIITTENGKTKTETYKGAEAKAKLEEMEKNMPKESGTKKVVKVHPDGKKEVRVEKHEIKKFEIEKEEDKD